MTTSQAIRIAAAELYRELPESNYSQFEDAESIHFIEPEYEDLKPHNYKLLAKMERKTGR